MLSSVSIALVRCKPQLGLELRTAQAANKCIPYSKGLLTWLSRGRPQNFYTLQNKVEDLYITGRVVPKYFDLGVVESEDENET